ncbi:hypothetical protein CC99x_003650 [Candidatus Berkiella cookevillensis]|nr:SidE phosphodiesterase domain-containing protein [Candidatus Berkiella cookevillensis]MCS5707992.1 hypothetical protein [Candidatus Berkiella cookevillensis]
MYKKKKAQDSAENQIKFNNQSLEEKYQTVIKDPLYTKISIETLHECFCLLEEAGWNEAEHSKLYMGLLNNPNYAKDLVDYFKQLKACGYVFEEYEIYYCKGIKYACYTKDLTESFGCFEKIEAPLNTKGLFLLQPMIEKSKEAHHLFPYLKELNEMGFTDEIIYSKLIEYSGYAKELMESLKYLKEKGFYYSECKKMYINLMHQASFARELIECIQNFKEMGYSYTQHQRYYDSLIDYPHQARKLVQAFKDLKEAGFSYESHSLLYDVIAAMPEKAKECIGCYKEIENFGFPLEKSKILFLSVINNSDYSLKLLKGFLLLKDSGFNLEEHEQLYWKLTNRPSMADQIAEGFELLKEIGFEYTEYPLLYQKFLDNIENIELFLIKCRSFNAGVFPYTQFKSFYHASILYPDFAQYIINNLIIFNPKDHVSLFNDIFSLLTVLNPNRSLIIRKIKKLVQYADTNVILTPIDEGFIQQKKELNALLREEFSFVEGPLKKASATYEIERILKQIAECNGEGVRLDYTDWRCYVLTLPNQETINISLLLRNANLSQLELNDSLLNSIDKMIKSIYSEWDEMLGRAEKTVQTLNDCLKKALYTYIGNYRYKNIGLVFRAEALDDKFSIIKVAEHKNKEALLCFILGCLINDATNKLNNLAIPPQVEDILLDRAEFLTNEVLAGRLANPWYFPALTSFSASKKGSVAFQKAGMVRTKLENPPSVLPIVNKLENEVLFSQGEQIITTQGPGFYVARIINSPSLEKANQYWSDQALQWALEHYLSKPYKECPSTIKIGDKNINRPNHNLPHVFRVKNAIELVIHYFSRYAIEDDFKEFCQECSLEEIEWLRVAAAFSVTGRESEINAGSDLERYDRYRESSATHFIDFVNKTKNMQLPEVAHMAERVKHVVRYMGNPSYEKQSDGAFGINNHPDASERQRRNFYYRILSVAHKLDLPRCYTASQYEASMKLCHDLSLVSDSQKNDYLEMIRYNIELIKAHGGLLSCDLTMQGKFVDTHIPYQPIYVESSTSLKRIYEISQTITKPEIMNPISTRHDIVCLSP